MVYLDYSATTPVIDEVLDSFNTVVKEFFGNPNSMHSLGVKSKELLLSARRQICDILKIKDNELIFTSGATEANNRALIGVCLSRKKFGNHIIVSTLEHPSIYEICKYLESLGFKISYVNVDSEGVVDLEHLKSLVTDKTILVSICGVNSETGVRQPLRTIKQVVKRENRDCYIHTDLTQGLGKIKINFEDFDLASFSAHKIYAPRGIGMLYKKDGINISPIMYGSNSMEIGTPPLALIVAFAKAIRLAYSNFSEKEEIINECTKVLLDGLKKYERIKLNRSKYTINQIINISLMDIKPETFIHAMERHDIYISSNTACSSGKPSTSIMAIYNDKMRASTTIRISISHLTTVKEIEMFLNVFDEEYNNLLNLVKGE